MERSLLKGCGWTGVQRAAARVGRILRDRISVEREWVAALEFLAEEDEKEVHAYFEGVEEDEEEEEDAVASSYSYDPAAAGAIVDSDPDSDSDDATLPVESDTESDKDSVVFVCSSDAAPALPPVIYCADEVSEAPAREWGGEEQSPEGNPEGGRKRRREREHQSLHFPWGRDQVVSARMSSGKRA